MEFLDPDYTNHDYTHDGVLEECKCECIIRDLCFFKDECSSEVCEESLKPYPLYTTIEEVVVSSMPETVLVYTHPSGGTIYHGPIITNLLKKNYEITPINYPYGTLDHGIDCYFIIGNYGLHFLTDLCRKITNLTSRRSYKVLYQTVPDVGSCGSKELRNIYTETLITIIYNVIRGLSVYIQGDSTKIQGMLYVIIGCLNMNSSLVFDKKSSIRHLELAYKKHEKEYQHPSKYYLQTEIIENPRFRRSVYHVTEVHGQNMLPDPSPDFLELPKIVPPTESALKSVFNRDKYNKVIKKSAKDFVKYLLKYMKVKCPLGYKIFQRKKSRIRIIHSYIFQFHIIDFQEYNNGLYTVD